MTASLPSAASHKGRVYAAVREGIDNCSAIAKETGLTTQQVSVILSNLQKGRLKLVERTAGVDDQGRPAYVYTVTEELPCPTCGKAMNVADVALKKSDRPADTEDTPDTPGIPDIPVVAEPEFEYEEFEYEYGVQ